MMMSWVTALMLMFSSGLGSGGGNELVLYIPIEEYWKAKGVEVSVEAMRKELALPEPADIRPLLTQLASMDAAERKEAAEKILAHGPAAVYHLERASRSPDPAISNEARALLSRIRAEIRNNEIRRLMAIRTLGQLDDPAGADVLRPLVVSEEPFIARHARIALAAITDEPYDMPGPADVVMDSDLWLLPADVGFVGQIRLAGGHPTGLDELLSQLPPDLQIDPREIRNRIISDALPVIERMGNVRLDALTFAISQNIGDNTGYVVLIGHGRFNAAAVSAVLREHLRPEQIQKEQDLDVFRPDGEVAVFFPSDNRAVLLAGPRHQPLPVAALVTAVQAGEGQLKQNQALCTIIQNVDRSQPLWAAVVIGDSYRQAPVIRAFDSISLVGRRENGATILEARGVGSDEQTVRNAVEELKGHLQAAIARMEPMTQHVPIVQPYLDLFKSIQLATDGKTATMSGKLSIPSPAALLFPMLGWRTDGRIEAEPQPAAPEAPVP